MERRKRLIVRCIFWGWIVLWTVIILLIFIFEKPTIYYKDSTPPAVSDVQTAD